MVECRDKAAQHRRVVPTKAIYATVDDNGPKELHGRRGVHSNESVSCPLC